MAEDRRVRKTKKAICDVFCELTKDKKLNEITIKELCAKADINKSTFYLHYRDIYDLAETIENELIRDVCRRWQKSGRYDCLRTDFVRKDQMDSLLSHCRPLSRYRPGDVFQQG